MDKETFSNYGWVIITVMVMAVMLAFATPFGEKAVVWIKQTADLILGFMEADTVEPAGGTQVSKEGCEYIYTYSLSEHGWSVSLNPFTTNNTKHQYGEIESVVNGFPVVTMERTFANCTNMTVAPKIPETVRNMDYTFLGCSSLLRTPTIPEGVESMVGTFQNCTSLRKAGTLPETLLNMQCTFKGCTALSDLNGMVIPLLVKNMDCTFQGCSALTGTLTVNANPEIWTQCLYGTGITAVTGETVMKGHILMSAYETAGNP